MSKVSAAQLAKFRKELRDHAGAITALTVLERCKGDIEAAVEAVLNRTQVTFTSSAGWLDQIGQQIICDNLIARKSLPKLANIAVGIVGSAHNIPAPLTAALAVLVAVYLEVKIDYYCNFKSSIPQPTALN